MIDQHGTLRISRSRLRHNLRLLRAAAPANALLCPTLKANAYGHGIDVLAPLLEQEGIEWACVYNFREALNPALLRFKTLVLAPLVLTAQPALSFINSICSNSNPLHHVHVIRLNLADAPSAHLLSEALRYSGRSYDVPIHIQVDTGLTRAGVLPREASDLARLVAGLPGLRLEGIFAHFSHADEAGHPTLVEQLQRFLEVALPLKKEFPGLVLHHQNSGGIFHCPRELAGQLDLVRVGIALYGLQPVGSVGGETQKAKLKTQNGCEGLRPIARLTAPIIAVHERGENTGVGYGHTFVTGRASRLAIVPVGYGDGYPRGLSNRGVGQCRGKTVPLVGRVSMDQLIFDVTDLGEEGPRVGEEVVVFSNDVGDLNSLDRVAGVVGTINYEIATGIGERVVRLVEA